MPHSGEKCDGSVMAVMKAVKFTIVSTNYEFTEVCYCSVKPGSHLRHNDITGRSRKRKKCLA